MKHVENVQYTYITRQAALKQKHMYNKDDNKSREKCCMTNHLEKVTTVLSTITTYEDNKKEAA